MFSDHKRALQKTEIEALPVDMWIATFGELAYEELAECGMIEVIACNGDEFVMLTERGYECLDDSDE